MDTQRYITRYNGKKGSRNTFCGWRLCITRQKETYVRYFTDREFGGMEESLSAALAIRASMMSEMERGIPFEQIAARYRKGAI
jgi:hypothetical protein